MTTKRLKPGYQKSGKYKGKFVVQCFGRAFGEYLGWAAISTHPDTACDGQGCSVHHPSSHSMKDWPQYWRADRGLMERVCPHGTGHPDPDDLAYKATIYKDDDPEAIAAYKTSYTAPYAATAAEKVAGESIHGCDGCCMSDETLAKIGMTRRDLADRQP